MVAFEKHFLASHPHITACYFLTPGVLVAVKVACEHLVAVGVGASRTLTKTSSKLVFEHVPLYHGAKVGQVSSVIGTVAQLPRVTGDTIPFAFSRHP